MTVRTMTHSVRCANSKRTREAISCSICAVVQRNRIRLGTPVWVFAPICLDSSDRLLKLERISIFTSIPRNELRKLQWNPPSHDSSGLDRRDGGTVLSSPRGQRRWLEHWQMVFKLSFRRLENNLFDLCRPPGNQVLNCTWSSGRDSVTEGQLTTLLQTAVRTWTTSLFVFFFCDGLKC